MSLIRPPSAQGQAAVRRKLIAAARMARRGLARNGRPLPRAWFMTDPTRTPRPVRVAQLLPAGFGLIFRHFGAKDRYETGARLARVCARRGLVLLVSADPDLARAIRADGVHWPEARLSGVRSRRPTWIETASVHSRAAIMRAARFGIDAAILSPVFESASQSAGRPIGLLAFRTLARAAPIPIYALGGIGASTAARAMTHAAGWAAVDAILEGWKT